MPFVESELLEEKDEAYDFDVVDNGAGAGAEDGNTAAKKAAKEQVYKRQLQRPKEKII